MKILVCISTVPDTTTKITFTNDSTEFNSSGVQFVINPYDEIALAKAIELCEGGKGTVTVINVGDSSTEPTIRKALAAGANEAVRVDTKPIDAWYVANQIAAYAKEENFDIILTGRESIDYNGAQVASFLGELLSLPSVSISKSIDIQDKNALIEREIEGGKEVINVPMPFIAGTSEGVAQPKIPNMRGIMSARTKPLHVIDAIDVSPISQIKTFEIPEPRSAVVLIPANEPEKLIDLLHNHARVI